MTEKVTGEIEITNIWRSQQQKQKRGPKSSKYLSELLSITPYQVGGKEGSVERFGYIA